MWSRKSGTFLPSDRKNSGHSQGILILILDMNPSILSSATVCHYTSEVHLLLVCIGNTKVEIDALVLELERSETKEKEMLAKLMVCVCSQFCCKDMSYLACFHLQADFKYS